jgi:lipoyl(octanoyl) transferase
MKWMEASANTDLPFSWLGRMTYEPMWARLASRAAEVISGSGREVIWACEHEPVYTTGKRGVDNRITDTLPAPMVHTDRGGETTFHGPGQIMLYPVISLRTRGLGVRAYVHLLEQSCIDMLAQAFSLTATRRTGMPGVWIDRGKVAAVGVRVSRGVACHGMALNVDVNPSWFAAINPCGTGMAASSLADAVPHAPAQPMDRLAGLWAGCFRGLI